MNFDWTDVWRVGLLLITVSCIFMLANRMRDRGGEWNPKTRDYWFSLMMWSIAGLVLSVEGILRNSEFGARLVFVTAAAITTLNGLRRKGSWGDHAA